MFKNVSIKMTDKSVVITIASYSEGDSCPVDTLAFELPFSLVSPQTALHIASALSQDATISKPSGDPKSVSE